MSKSNFDKRLVMLGSAITLLLVTAADCLPAEAVIAIPCADFLDSIGTLSAISVRGENLDGTIKSAKYLGIRWLRAGIERNVPIDHFIQLHQQAGLRFSWGLGSGGTNIANLLTIYLDQFKRGWSYTAVYLLRDRVDEGGNQQFGFYKPDYSPRKAALYLHNLTTILADKGTLPKPGKLAYSIPAQSETTHDLLLEKSNGTFEFLVWNEQLKGSRNLTVTLGLTCPSVSVYDSTFGPSPARTLTNISSIELILTDHPLVLELRTRD